MAPTRQLAWMIAIGSCACHPSDVRPSGPALPLGRIAIAGASVSAGLGGLPFGDAFTEAVRHSVSHSEVESEANLMLFRDPVGETTAQIDKAIAFKAQTIVGLDLLFWDVYSSTDPVWRDAALASGLANLERARATGAWIIVGDIPRVVTAAEWLLSRDHIPDVATLAAQNAKITAWARGRERVIVVPFAAWAEPLARGGEVEIAPGEKVSAATMVAADGLHANPLGTWYLLDKLDHLIEATLPGTPKDALVFQRPR